ncbi:MAG: hypothetical protein Tsb0020_01020 [Haliangiales bacterium]
MGSPSPAVDPLIIEQRAAAYAIGGDRNSARNRRRKSRLVRRDHLRCGERTETIVSPAGHLTCGQAGTADIETCRDFDRVVDSSDRLRLVAVTAVPAELTVPVRAPTPDLSASQRTEMLPTSGERFDRIELSDQLRLR